MQVNTDTVHSQIMLTKRHLSFAGGTKILVMHKGAQELDLFPRGRTNQPFYAGFTCLLVHNSLCRERDT